MILNNQQKLKKKQDGLVLLVLVIAIALTLSSFYFSSISVLDIQLENNLNTQAELKRAKQALLNYAVSRWQAPGNSGNIGKLPCPDTAAATVANEGVQDAPCGTAYENAIGLLPWRTLGIDIANDSSNNCFWYVVSPGYKVTPLVSLNPDSYGQIQIVDALGAVVQGATPEQRPVAAVIASGKALPLPLPGQLRAYDEDSQCGMDYGNAVAYLDFDGTTDNAAVGGNNTINTLIRSYAGSEDTANPLNDKIITITHQEIWNALQSSISSVAFNTRMDQLTEAIAMCFAAYGSNNQNHLPMPAPLDISGDEYRNHLDYDASADFTVGFSGRLPYTIAAANAELTTPTVPLNNNKLPENDVCTDIDLIVGTYNDINLQANTGADQGEFLNLWRNWQDHFFYAVSAANKPDSGATACAGNCISIAASGTEYAGMVFFAGIGKEAGQQRYTRPLDQLKAVDNADDKDEVANYLENGNAVFFPDNIGNQIYSNVTGGNDIMFCITPAMTVERC